MFLSKDIEDRPYHSVRIEGTDVEVLAYPLLGPEHEGSALIIRIEKAGRTIFHSTLTDVLIDRMGLWSEVHKSR